MNLVKKISEIPHYSISSFRSELIKKISEGERLVSLWGMKDLQNKETQVKLFAVTSLDEKGTLSLFSTHPPKEYLSLTEDCPSVHLFEREILENFHITPVGHPWPKPVRHNPSFFQVEGDEIHEVGVGPVHAGVIEPGHFRFQCHGEIIKHLEIALGYQHRGVEEKIIKYPQEKILPLIETVSGDSTCAHSWTYLKNIEGLTQFSVDRKSLLLRAVMLELERLANHIGDLGALAGDVGFLPTSNYCGRIRGDFLNLSLFISGSRFSRSMFTETGVNFDLANEKISEFIKRLKQGRRDALGAINLLWKSITVLDRFENTGIVTPKVAKEIGLVGVPARASGLLLDTRKNFDSDKLYVTLKMATEEKGDVLSRAKIRFQEIISSLDLIQNFVNELSSLPYQIPTKLPPLPSDMISLSLIEGWRGEVFHALATDKEGKIAHYKITDPSFHNWFGLALSLREEEISDFPLCNKSFNLSYCGFDL